MSLQVKNKITPNQSTRDIILSDITGVYSVTNLTGYGAPQTPLTLREIADILTSNISILDYNGTLSYNGSTTPTVVSELYATDFNNSDSIALAGGTTQTISLGTLVPDTYIDAVYKSIYYNWFNATTTTPITYYSSNTVSVGDTDQFTGASYVNIYFGGVHKIYDIISIDTVNSRVTLNGTVSNILNTESYTIGYSSTSYFANTYAINKCLNQKIAKLAISDCSCDNKCAEKLYENVMLYNSIQINIDLEKYQKAQDIITYLSNYCNDGCCNC